ncbi:MAG: PKD domain-containing protein [Bacteroidales bacterium]|nr:PKD domain-containing protein [Bacteroidales bacterium]
MKHKSTSLALAILLISCITFGQQGNEFWLAAPNISNAHNNNSIPLNLHITAEEPTTVTISRPADPSFVPFAFELNENETEVIALDSDARCNLDVSEIEVYAFNPAGVGFAQKKGFLIEAYPGTVSAYYELGGLYNMGIATLKAENALGTDFYVSTQNAFKNHGYSDDFSGFTVIAAEDDTTTITINNPNGVDLRYLGTAASYQVKLAKGETFAIEATYQAAGQHIQGIHISSDKKIAVMVFDDSMQMADGGTWDVMIDQLVPTSLLGTEYVVVKGNVEETTPSGDKESIFITATQANTGIYIDGSLVTTITNAGDYYSYQITVPALHLKSSKPVLVNHITGYDTSSVSRELGGAVLPAFNDCKGSYKVTTKKTAGSDLLFYHNLVVKNDTSDTSACRNKAIQGFTYSINGGSELPMQASHFTYIMDSTYAYYDRAKAGNAAYYYSFSDEDVIKITNNEAQFHLGIVQANKANGCKYGYVSNFSQPVPKAGIGGTQGLNTTIKCSLDTLQLFASGGKGYKWFPTEDGADTLLNYLNHTSISNPVFYTPGYGIYKWSVEITSNCQDADTLYFVLNYSNPQADFSITDSAGCAIFKPVINDLTNDLGVDKKLWLIDTTWYNSDTTAFPLQLSFENQTDTAIHKIIKLVASSVDEVCADSISDTLLIYPRPKPAFTMEDTLHCNEQDALIDNQWPGDPTGYTFSWNFGDSTFSTSVNPTKYYLNELKDTLYKAQLTITNSFGCDSTVSNNIYVKKNHMATSCSLSQTSGCSPLKVYVDGSSSWGADQINWYLISSQDTLEYVTETDSLLYLLVYHKGDMADVDTQKLMAVMTEDICQSSFTRNLTIIPSPVAELTNADSIGKSPLNFTFTNTSSGESLTYYWDFDNGNTSTLKEPTQSFTSDDSTTYKILLKVSNSYSCSDSLIHKLLVIHPSDVPSIQLDELNIHCYTKQQRLVIDLSESTYASVSARVIDFNGKIVLQEDHLRNDIYTSSKTFNAGVYFVIIQIDGKLYNSKFVIQ